MMKTICDRCGEICAPPYGQDSSVPILRKQLTGSIFLSNMDLCEKCKEELTMLHRNFLKMKGSEDEITKVKITERGWAGHFICANYCRFRRNTLIEYKDKKWIVSTVGAMVIENEYTEIGYRRWYETMAFVGEEKNGYIDAKVSQEIPFDSEWGIFGDTWKQVLEANPNIDNAANDMHDTVVKELAHKIVGKCKGGEDE